jgi:hypothetical protein
MANEKRLIYANALTHEIIFVEKCLASKDKAGEWAKGYRSGLVAALAQIDETPSVDAVEVVHGRWEIAKTVAFTEECSVCGFLVEWDAYGRLHQYNYCPNCGASMMAGERKDNA